MILRKKLKSILLVDDDDAAIFLHSTVIQMLDCTEKIIVTENGEEAIKLLSEKQDDGEYLRPSLIFLDINMPRMNGWEFLETYKRLDLRQRAEVIIVMLTTSLNPSDRERALKIDEVSGFMNKPITMESLKETLHSYFPDFVQP